MGDFNDVRCKEERLGSLFNPLGTRLFNQFINSSGLVEVKLKGYSFTWSHPSASKMSKLDRFLVTEDPVKVKDTFKDHFQSRFEQPSPNHFKLSSPFTKRLSPDQVVDMDSNVSRNEIRRAVWDCGDNKSPGPDGYSFEFFQKNILDGPFILNELLSWCKKSKKQAMFFKVDFAKAYDSVRWDYLLDVLYAFGFGPKWCRWIWGIFFFREGFGPGEWEPNTPKGVLKEMEAIRSKFFNGADTSERKITWIAWQKALASKIHGGLGISSFYALNRTLLLKWVWRFISHDGSLWSKVIQAIYGASFELQSSKQVSLWCFILREVHSLKAKGFDFISHYVEKEVSVAAKLGSVSINVSFKRDGYWICDLSGDGEYRVKEVRNFIDDLFLPSHPKDLSLVGFGCAELDVIFRLRFDLLDGRFTLRSANSGFTAGQAALKASSCKVTKHEKACIENQHVFISVLKGSRRTKAQRAYGALS
nr:RNA-directed DNA polymerase, eukaryota, reverse transcriptase zinc-binding domain protein [Tanacetum cinerariifolium]